MKQFTEIPSDSRVIRDGAAVGPQLWRLVRDWIVRGELQPGTRLSEVDVAAGFNVSRQPVREAFIKLAEEGLVEIRPQRGTFVSRIRVEAVAAAQFVREAVEADIVRIVAEKATDALVAELQEIVDAQRSETDSSDPQAFFVLDEQFHHRLADVAGQRAGWNILQPLKTQMDRVRYLNARHFPRAKLIDQHDSILAAIRARDPDAAEAAMRVHLRQILNDLSEIVEALPQFFDLRGRGAE